MEEFLKTKRELNEAFVEEGRNFLGHPFFSNNPEIGFITYELMQAAFEMGYRKAKITAYKRELELKEDFCLELKRLF